MPISLLSSSVYSLTPDFFSSASSSAIVSIFFSPNCFPFHYFQFLSNLPQYSWSYLLSDYPKSFFAVNLLGNSPLLNILSFHSCFAISSISCWYSFSNSSIASCVFFKFSLLSQVLDSTVNPFQHTKYLSFSLTHCLFRILSVTNFIQSYLHQIFDDSHGLKASLKPLKRPFDWYQSRLEAINIGWDIKQINW